MHGYIIIHFRPSQVGIEASDLPQLTSDSISAKQLKHLETIFSNTPLKKLRPANLLHSNGTVSLTKNGLIVVREALRFDPRNRKLTIEPRYDGIETRQVRINCKIDESPGRKCEKLQRGHWNSGKTVGVMVTSAPTEAALFRVNIYVLAPTITKARTALLDTLTGKRQPNKPWLV